MSASSIKSQSGFTLVEMMVTAAIVGILILAFTGWLFQQVRQTKDITNSQSYSQLRGGVMDAASQAEALSKSEALMFDPNLNGGVAPTPAP